MHVQPAAGKRSVDDRVRPLDAGAVAGRMFTEKKKRKLSGKVSEEPGDLYAIGGDGREPGFWRRDAPGGQA